LPTSLLTPIENKIDEKALRFDCAIRRPDFSRNAIDDTASHDLFQGCVLRIEAAILEDQWAQHRS
jgi:hypothetical protein